MSKDDLIHIWEEGNDRMFSEKKTDKEMITKYLNEKTLKGNRSVHFNIFFYGAVQLANIILLSMNISGYLNNPPMVWLLIGQLVATIGILIFGIDMFYRFREINNYSESLAALIGKQIRFFRRPYELWLILASLSAIILALNLGFLVDNDNGTYAVNNKLMFTGVLLGTLLFIYGSQKIASLHSFRSLKAYLGDLQSGVLDQSSKLESQKRKLVWLWIIVFVLLTIALAGGIVTAIRFTP